MSGIKRIIVIDDDLIVNKICSHVIKKNLPGVEACLFTSPEKGLEFIHHAYATNPVETLLLLDINMPVMSGKETLKRLKQDQGYSNIPVVVFTTSSNPSDEAFFSQFGVPVHTKPDKFHTMVSKVKTFLNLCE